MAEGDGLRELVTAELKKDGVMRELKKRAGLRARTDWDMKDLLAEALSRVIDPDDMPWDPSKEFVGHVTFAIRHSWYRRTHLKSEEAEVFDGGVAQENTGLDQPPVDQQVERARLLDVHRTLGDRLIDRLPASSRPRQLFELLSREDLTPSETATRLDCTVAEVHAAEKQVKYYGTLVKDEWEVAEERRMSALRERARQSKKEGAS
jgi:DNA-directed RNA polymerase specialized sigma24 family protein